MARSQVDHALRRDAYSSPFPPARQCQDGFWALLFVIVAAGVLGSSVYHTSTVLDYHRGHSNENTMSPAHDIHAVGNGKDDDTDPAQASQSATVILTQVLRRLAEADTAIPLGSAITSTLCGSFAGLVIVIIYFYLLKTYPDTTVRASLWAAPVLFLILATAYGMFGLSCYNADRVDLGNSMLIMAASFLLSSFCFACQALCLSSLIPFTVKVVKAVMQVCSEHPALFMIAILSMILSTAWLVLCCFAGLGLYIQMEYTQPVNCDNWAWRLVFMFFFSFVSYWGSMVAMNMAVVAYAGVFGRWYFGKTGPMTCPSFQVAMTTSFGSVCFGSLIVAFVRAAEKVARQIQENANNPVTCLIACAIQCILGCIGDNIEYFNAWAYIQCAVRNASFRDAAKITHSMCTSANVHLIFSDVLVGTVAGTGTLLGSLFGLLFGGGIGYSMSGGHTGCAAVGAIAAFFAALVVGSIICDIIATGTKTLLVLWAEAPGHGGHGCSLHNAFEDKVREKLAGEAGANAVRPAMQTAASDSGPCQRFWERFWDFCCCCCLPDHPRTAEELRRRRLRALEQA